MSETITIPIVISGIGVIFTALTYLNMHYRENTKTQERLKALEEQRKILADLLETLVKSVEAVRACVTINTDRIGRLETKMELFWNAMSDFAADALHKPHPEFAHMDELLEKWKLRTITVAEIEELRDLLCDLMDRNITKKKNGDVYWASFLISRLNAFLYDAKHSMILLTS